MDEMESKKIICLRSPFEIFNHTDYPILIYYENPGQEVRSPIYYETNVKRKPNQPFKPTNKTLKGQSLDPVGPQERVFLPLGTSINVLVRIKPYLQHSENKWTQAMAVSFLFLN